MLWIGASLLKTGLYRTVISKPNSNIPYYAASVNSIARWHQMGQRLSSAGKSPPRPHHAVISGSARAGWPGALGAGVGSVVVAGHAQVQRRRWRRGGATLRQMWRRREAGRRAVSCRLPNQPAARSPSATATAAALDREGPGNCGKPRRTLLAGSLETRHSSRCLLGTAL